MRQHGPCVEAINEGATNRSGGRFRSATPLQIPRVRKQKKRTSTTLSSKILTSLHGASRGGSSTRSCSTWGCCNWGRGRGTQSVYATSHPLVHGQPKSIRSDRRPTTYQTSRNPLVIRNDHTLSMRNLPLIGTIALPTTFSRGRLV